MQNQGPQGPRDTDADSGEEPAGGAAERAQNTPPSPAAAPGDDGAEDTQVLPAHDAPEPADTAADDAPESPDTPADDASEPAPSPADTAGTTASPADTAESTDAPGPSDAAVADDAAGAPSPHEPVPEVARTSIKDRLAAGAGVHDLRGSDDPTVVRDDPAVVGDDTAGVDDEPTGGRDAPTVVATPAVATTPADATTSADAQPSSTHDQDPQVSPKKKPRKKRRLAKAGIWTAVVLLVLTGLYVGAAYLLADRVPADTSVAGVDISGLSITDAEGVLTEELGTLETEPLPLTFADSGAEIEPASAGLSFDATATVDQFTGFTLDPRILMGHLFGLGDQEPVTGVDQDTLHQALESLAEDLDVSPVEGSITIVDADVEISEPEDGAAVDIEAAAEMIADEWITGERPLELPLQVLEPEMGRAQIQAAMDEVVEPFLSGPVVVAVNDTEVELTVAEMTEAATLERDGDRYTLALDGAALAEVVTDKEDSIGESPRDARIELQDGEPTIIPAVTGTGLDPETLGESVTEAALRTGAEDRVAEVELTQTEAEFSTEDAEALGVVEVIGRYSTPMPYDPPRTENLQIGTARINNTLLLPGERFSLLDALSPITTAAGYNSSGVVVNGFTSEAAGGGLSQLSTTAFNAAFEAGLEDVTHQPHSRWFSRYPEGREATLFSPDLDMIFANNTDYGVLIQAWVGDGQTHVVLWGTKVWDVDITTGPRYNITSPQTVYNQDPRCVAESGGQTGFTVQYTRTVSRDGEVHEQRTYTHTYRPWNRVVCGSPPSASGSDNGDSDDD